MSAFPNWQKFAVHQKRWWSGCIATGYEMMLRAANARGIDFNTFQDDFDLDQNPQVSIAPRNNFATVSAEVQKKYPQVEFKHESFNTGAEKLARIEALIQAGKPVLISLWMGDIDKNNLNWHTMPVVDMDQKNLTLLVCVDPTGAANAFMLPKSELIRIHDNFAGGKDVAYLEKC